MWIEIIRKTGIVTVALVTSLAEVWIEIYYMQKNENWNDVTSLAEVWIEIDNEIQILSTI